jgi:hypothetical protein
MVLKTWFDPLNHLVLPLLNSQKVWECVCFAFSWFILGFILLAYWIVSVMVHYFVSISRIVWFDWSNKLDFCLVAVVKKIGICSYNLGNEINAVDLMWSHAFIILVSVWSRQPKIVVYLRMNRSLPYKWVLFYPCNFFFLNYPLQNLFF